MSDQDGESVSIRWRRRDYRSHFRVYCSCRNKPLLGRRWHPRQHRGGGEFDSIPIRSGGRTGEKSWETKNLGLDPTEADTDGDGLSDSEEVTLETELVDGQQPTLDVTLADSPVAHPNVANTDGVGLNDGEELEKGSNPYIQELFIAGVNVPTMTEGPETMEPMTTGEADGMADGNNRYTGDLIVSHQKIFQKEGNWLSWFSAKPTWLEDVSVKDGKVYLYIPVVVYAQTNKKGDVSFLYQLSLENADNGAKIVNGKTEGVVPSEKGSVRTYIVVEMNEGGLIQGGLSAYFERMGELKIQFTNVDNTIYDRSDRSASARKMYSVSKGTLLNDTIHLLETTRFVYENGMLLTGAVQSGHTAYVSSGSVRKALRMALYEFTKEKVKGELKPAPTKPDEFAQAASIKGIAAFETKIDDTQDQIDEEIFGDGLVRPTGPQIVRRN